MIENEDALRRVLAAAVPEVPPTPDRAAEARLMARTARRLRIASASGAIAVTAAVALAVVLAPGHESRSPAPVATDTATGGPVCPKIPTKNTPPHDLAGTGDATLAVGATSARLCNVGGFPWQAPADALRTRVDELVDLINGTPAQKTEENQICPANLGPTYGFAFGYRDGSTRFVTAAAYGCEAIEVGGVTRGTWDDVNALRKRFLALLSDQRAGEAPEDPITVPLSCGDAGWAPGGKGISLFGNDPQPDLTAAILCWKPMTNTEQPIGTAAIPAAELATLLADMEAHRVAPSQVRDTECPADALDLRIVGQNRWGDRFAIYGFCGGFRVTDHSFWKPDAASQAIIGRLAGEPIPLPLPGPEDSAADVVRLWGDLVNLGDDRSRQLWAHDAPSTKGRITLKVDAVRADSGSVDDTWGQVAEVDAYFAQATTDQCGPYGEKTFVLVRADDREPWRIASWSDHGPEHPGC